MNLGVYVSEKPKTNKNSREWMHKAAQKLLLQNVPKASDSLKLPLDKSPKCVLNHVQN